MNKGRGFKIFVLALKELKNPYYSGFAAQMSFYLLLSIVPMIIIISQGLSLFHMSLEFIETYVETYLGSGATQLIKESIEKGTMGYNNIAFLVILVWSASKAQYSLIKMTNYVFSKGESVGQGFWIERFRAIKTFAITFITISASLILFVYSEQILDLVINILFTGFEFAILWSYIKWPIAVAMYFLMVSFNYYILPSKKVAYKSILPGSILASVGMVIMTYLFSIYTKHSESYALIYGSLASIVALLMWFFLLAWVILAGIIFNRLWGETKNMP